MEYLTAAVLFLCQGIETASGGNDPLLNYGHKGAISSIAVTADGKSLFAGGSDGKIVAWDLARPTKPKFSLEMPNQVDATALMFLPNNKLASGLGDGSLLIWDLRARKHDIIQMKKEGSIRCLTLSLDGKWLAFSMGTRVGIVNLADGTSVLVMQGEHSGEVCSLAISKDSKRLAAGGGDGAIKVWSVTSRQVIKSLTGHASPVTGVVFCNDDKKIVSGGWDEKIIVWDWNAGEAKATFVKKRQAISSCCYCPTTEIVAFGTFANTVRSFDLKKMSERPAISVKESVESLSFYDGGKRLAVGYGNCFGESGKGANTGQIEVLEFFP